MSANGYSIAMSVCRMGTAVCVLDGVDFSQEFVRTPLEQVGVVCAATCDFYAAERMHGCYIVSGPADIVTELPVVEAYVSVSPRF